MAKVLVTGASGFIGYHMAQLLVEQGEEVTCLVRKTSKTNRLSQLGVIQHCGDLDDRQSLAAAVAGKSTVYQVAGCVKALRTEELFRVNEHGVRNLLEVCAEPTTPPVVVTVSSLAAAGPSPDGHLRTETDPLVQVSYYGQSKRQGELAAQTLADRVPVSVVRPPIVLGEGDTNGLSLFQSIARTFVHMVPGLQRHLFSVIHAADLVRGISLVAQRGQRLHPQGAESPDPLCASQGYYFLAGPEHVTYDALGTLVGQALGRRGALVLHAPAAVVWGVATVVELAAKVRRQPALLNYDKIREALAGDWTCSPQKAADQLGFSVATPLLERLRQTAQWYRKEGWL